MITVLSSTLWCHSRLFSPSSDIAAICHLGPLFPCCLPGVSGVFFWASVLSWFLAQPCPWSNFMSSEVGSFHSRCASIVFWQAIVSLRHVLRESIVPNFLLMYIRPADEGALKDLELLIILLFHFL
jgi:hypothetical protein